MVVLRQHNVLGFNVSVNYAARMAVVNSREELPHVLGGLFLSEHLARLLSNLLEQRHTIDILHNYSNSVNALLMLDAA